MKAREIFTRNLRYLMLVLIIVLLIVTFSLIMPSFLRLDNIMNIIRQTSVLAIIAIGMTGTRRRNSMKSPPTVIT